MLHRLFNVGDSMMTLYSRLTSPLNVRDLMRLVVFVMELNPEKMEAA